MAKEKKNPGREKEKCIQTGISAFGYIPFPRENPHEQAVDKQENNYNDITCKAAEKSAYLLSENRKHILFIIL